MTRKLDKVSAVALVLASISIVTAAMALVLRSPCEEGAVRFLDVTPALPWVSAALALIAGWRLARTMSWFPWPRQHRVIGVVASVALLLVTMFICFMSTGTLLSTIGDPTTDCWSF